MRQNLIDFLQVLEDKFLQKRNFIPLHEPVFQGNEKKYLNDTIDSGFVSSVGAYVDKFEEEFAGIIGSKYAIATVNGTSALHTALILSDVQPDDEVLTQAITFIATTNAISYTGAHPVFLDIEDNGVTLSYNALNDFILNNTQQGEDGFTYNMSTGRRIKACIPVHVFGMMGDIQRISDLCKKHNIDLIEDAAESLGSKINGVSSGKFGKTGVFSFNGNKIVTAGGGGVIVSDDEELSKRAKHITTTAKVPHAWNYEHDEIGFNYRMPNVNAALLCAQLEQLPHFLLKKRELKEFYYDCFNNLDIEIIRPKEGEDSNFWLFNLLTESKQEKEEFLKLSNSKGIMTRPLWKPMNELKMYKDCEVSDLSNSKTMADRLVNLPSSVNLL